MAFSLRAAQSVKMWAYYDSLIDSLDKWIIEIVVDSWDIWNEYIHLKNYIYIHIYI